MESSKDRYDRLSKRMEESGALPVPILIVEDDDFRVKVFNSWLPPVFRLVHCRTGGAALGLVSRSDSWAFPGVMMDFDLDKQVVTKPYVDGGQVLNSVLLTLDSSTNILVHSANWMAAQRMAAIAGVTNPTIRIDYNVMDERLFCTWLGDVWAEAVDRIDVFVSHELRAVTSRYACVVGPDWLDDEPLAIGGDDEDD